MTASDPFATISKEYAAIYSVFKKAAGLLSGPAFISTYGDLLDDAEGVEQMASALSVIDEAARDLGSPASVGQLLSADPNAVSETYSKSDTLYIGLIKMATATQNASSTLASTLSVLPTMLTGDGETITGNIKTALSGWGGATQSGNRARDAAHDLSARFAALEKKVEPALVTLSGSMLNNLATRNVASIELLEQDIEEAKTAYEDAIFGKGKKKAVYDDLSAKLAEKEPQLELSRDFIAAVKGLDVAAMDVMPALQRLSNCLTVIEQRFVDSAANLSSVASDADNSQLSNRDWLDKALNLPDAADAWSQLAQQSQNFVQNSL